MDIFWILGHILLLCVVVVVKTFFHHCALTHFNSIELKKTFTHTVVNTHTSSEHSKPRAVGHDVTGRLLELPSQVF